MKTNKFSMSGLLRVTARRHTFGCLGMILMLALMHYWNHKSFEIADLGHALIALLGFAAVALLIEFTRQRNGAHDTTKR